MNFRVFKQYLEQYHISGITDLFLNISKQKSLPYIPPKKESSKQNTTIPEPLIMLREQCENCDLCKYRKDRQKLVFGKGSPKAKCIILGNPVNQDENLTGFPFGKSNSTIYSEQFNKIIQKGLIEGEKLPLTSTDLYLTNITKCRVMSLDYEEIKKCVPFLIKQIEIIKPKIMLVFGEIAANALFNKTEHIDFYRNNQGQLFNDIPVFVTFNPMDMIKTDILKKMAWNDLKKFSEYYKNLFDIKL